MIGDLFPIFLVALVMTVVATFMIVKRYRRKSRQKRIWQTASSMGLLPVSQPENALAFLWQQRFLMITDELKKAGSGVENLLVGNIERQRVHLFDYEMYSPHETNVWQSVVVPSSRDAGLPAFALLPRKLKKERFTQRLVTATRELSSKARVAYRNIQLPIDGYKLSCPAGSEQAVRALFTSAIVEYFSNHSRYTVEGNGTHLRVYERGRLVAADALKELFQHSLSFLQLLTKTNATDFT